MSFNKFDNEKPIFNQAALFVERLDKLSEFIDAALIDGNLKNVYRLMNRVYTRLEALAEENKEKVYLDKSFETYKENIEQKFKEVKDLVFSKDMKLNNAQVEKKLGEIDLLIYRIQWGLKLVLPGTHGQTFGEKMRVGYE